MAQHDFWRGFRTAIIISTILALVWFIDIQLFSVVLLIIVLTLLHNFLADVRDRMQQKHHVRKVQAIANALYPDNDRISIRFLEIRQHVGVNFVKATWVAGVGSMGTAKGNMMLIQTKAPAMTRETALVDLQNTLAKKVINKFTRLPTATETIV